MDKKTCSNCRWDDNKATREAPCYNCGWVKLDESGLIQVPSKWEASKEHAEKMLLKSMTTDDDPVNHPSHYTSHPSGVETITITEHMNFCQGNVIKYVMRCEHKGNKKQDLEKAMFYLKREIERITNE